MTTSILPAYLNEDFILEALNPGGFKKIVIISLEIERNTLGGNYCSDIYRAKVKYATKINTDKDEVEDNANLLIKDLHRSVQATSQEHFTYTKLLPLMEDILAKAGIKAPALSPKLFLARKAESELHVFEDMCALGYEICDRYQGFDLAASKKVIEKLSNFHATSMFVMQKHAELVSKLSDHFWLNNPAFSTFVNLIIDENIKHIAPIVKKWPGYEQIAEKLLKNTGAVFEERFFKMFEKSAAKINVIAHGDLWIKNILVKSGDAVDDGDAVFIDYQNCFIGSPAFDLQNIFMTSLHTEVLEHQREFLIEYYYETLCKVINQCNTVEPCLELPKFEDLLSEIERLEYFTFYALIFAFPQTNLSEELAQDMDYGGFFEPKRLAVNRLDMFVKPRVLETLKFVLKRLDNAGVLD